LYIPITYTAADKSMLLTYLIYMPYMQL